MNAGQVRFFEKEEQMQRWIENLSNWKLCQKTRYQVMIQRASADKRYGDVKEPGIVYNFFEDSMEPVVIPGFVITGTCGEMWPVSQEVVIQNYEVELPEGVQEIGDVPLPAWSRGKSGQMKAAIQIPAEILFEVVLADGKTVLKGNRAGVGHGTGDYLLFDLKWKNKWKIKKNDNEDERLQKVQKDDWSAYLEPAEAPGLRIVNGALFQKTYECVSMLQIQKTYCL